MKRIKVRAVRDGDDVSLLTSAVSNAPVFHLVDLNYWLDEIGVKYEATERLKVFNRIKGNLIGTDCACEYMTFDKVRGKRVRRHELRVSWE